MRSNNKEANRGSVVINMYNNDVMKSDHFVLVPVPFLANALLGLLQPGKYTTVILLYYITSVRAPAGNNSFPHLHIELPPFQRASETYFIAVVI